MGVLYGLDKELKQKLDSKVDEDLRSTAVSWIENVVGEKCPEAGLPQWLKSGVVLCEVVNKIQPGIVKKISKSALPFQQMENINSYLRASRELGVQDFDQFMTVDLFEEKNIGAVIQNILALARAAQKRGFAGPEAKVGRRRSLMSTSEKEEAESKPVEKTVETEDTTTSAKLSTADASQSAQEDTLYGLDKELKEKALLKAGSGLDVEAKQWIEALLNEQLDGDLMECLKSGVVLCNVANKLKEGTIKKISTSKLPFQQMENIDSYLRACRETFKLPPHDLFMTVDLFEKKNPNAVIQNIHSLGRIAQMLPGYTGPKLGVKLAQRWTANFTEEQLMRAKAQPSLQTLGSHASAQSTVGAVGGFTASGQFDTSKSIIKSSEKGDFNVPTKLSMGSVGGANAAGMFDRSREIIRNPAEKESP